MKSILTKIKRLFQIIYKTPRLLLIFLISFTLVTSVLFQQSLEIAVLRLLFVYFSFKVTFYLMENNPIYKKGISVESTELEKGYSSHTILSEQNFLSKWIDSFVSTLSGERQTFHLTNVSYSFLVVKPTYLNLPYIFFCRCNKYFWFNKLFKLVLMYPYFITETRTGSFFFGVCFFSMLLLQNIFSMIIVIETFFLLVTLLIFFRFEGVYQYCIDTYGTEFVEKYIGNPMTSPFIKRLAGKAIVYTVSAAVSAVGAVALNIADQSYHNDMSNKEIDSEIARRQKLGQTITFDQLTRIEKDIRKKNLTLLEKVTKTIIELKKK